METIAITGGKGGVGKSTVSVLLANKFRREGKKVMLVDLDVECPNDHLLLGRELASVGEKVYAKFPKLNKEKCTKCLHRGSGATLRGGLCVEKCPNNAIFQPPGEYPLFMHDLCSGCGLCWNLCPFGAIEIEEKITGEIFVNQLGTPAAGKTSPDESGEVGECGEDFPSAWLVSGRSVGVVEETGPVVAEVKKFAYQLAEEKGVDVILLDTAPGLHCAVIRALWEVDKAYAVTEPTPLGAHDLRLILKLLKKLRIPAKIILNQADLGDRDSVDNIAHNLNTEIAYEIPYSKEIVNAYSKGRLYDFSLQHF